MLNKRSTISMIFWEVTHQISTDNLIIEEELFYLPKVIISLTLMLDSIQLFMDLEELQKQPQLKNSELTMVASTLTSELSKTSGDQLRIYKPMGTPLGLYLKLLPSEEYILKETFL